MVALLQGCPPDISDLSIQRSRRDSFRSSRPHTPLTVQRRVWRWLEFQLANSGGRSRQGAPVRAIQRMPSSTRRWLRGGRPRRGPAPISKGAKNDRSSSVSIPRAKLTSGGITHRTRSLTPLAAARRAYRAPCCGRARMASGKISHGHLCSAQTITDGAGSPLGSTKAPAATPRSKGRNSASQ